MRAVVVGPSGSGKTTFAQKLALAVGAPHVELDALLWGPGWTKTERAAYDAAVDDATSGDRWVVSGNHPLARKRATVVVWLDLPLHVVLPRIVLRSARRLVTREVLWNGNRESLRRLVRVVRVRNRRLEWNEDNLFGWTITSHDERRRAWTGQMKELACPVHRIERPEEVAHCLGALIAET